MEVNNYEIIDSWKKHHDWLTNHWCFYGPERWGKGWNWRTAEYLLIMQEVLDESKK